MPSPIIIITPPPLPPDDEEDNRRAPPELSLQVTYNFAGLNPHQEDRAKRIIARMSARFLEDLKERLDD